VATSGIGTGTAGVVGLVAAVGGRGCRAGVTGSAGVAVGGAGTAVGARAAVTVGVDGSAVSGPAPGAPAAGLDTGGSAGTELGTTGVAGATGGRLGVTLGGAPVRVDGVGGDVLLTPSERPASSWKPGIRLGIALAATGGAAGGPEVTGAVRRRDGTITAATSDGCALLSGN
jgi:hypothetical protein